MCVEQKCLAALLIHNNRELSQACQQKFTDVRLRVGMRRDREAARLGDKPCPPECETRAGAPCRGPGGDSAPDPGDAGDRAGNVRGGKLPSQRLALGGTSGDRAEQESEQGFSVPQRLVFAASSGSQKLSQFRTIAALTCPGQPLQVVRELIGVKVVGSGRQNCCTRKLSVEERASTRMHCLERHCNCVNGRPVRINPRVPNFRNCRLSNPSFLGNRARGDPKLLLSSLQSSSETIPGCHGRRHAGSV